MSDIQLNPIDGHVYEINPGNLLNVHHESCPCGRPRGWQAEPVKVELPPLLKDMPRFADYV